MSISNRILNIMPTKIRKFRNITKNRTSKVGITALTPRALPRIALVAL
jgi:hypothetical protein